MPTPERYWRFTSAATRARVAARAGVADEPWMQDWPIEVADPLRVADFIALLQATSDSDERFALMGLILASLDACDALARTRRWPIVAASLEAGALEYADLVIYWACLESRSDGSYEAAGTEDEMFPITPAVREVLVRVRARIGFLGLRVPTSTG